MENSNRAKLLNVLKIILFHLKIFVVLMCDVNSVFALSLCSLHQTVVLGCQSLEKPLFQLLSHIKKTTETTAQSLTSRSNSHTLWYRNPHRGPVNNLNIEWVNTNHWYVWLNTNQCNNDVFFIVQIKVCHTWIIFKAVPQWLKKTEISSRSKKTVNLSGSICHAHHFTSDSDGLASSPYQHTVYIILLIILAKWAKGQFLPLAYPCVRYDNASGHFN